MATRITTPLHQQLPLSFAGVCKHLHRGDLDKFNHHYIYSHTRMQPHSWVQTSWCVESTLNVHSMLHEFCSCTTCNFCYNLKIVCWLWYNELFDIAANCCSCDATGVQISDDSFYINVQMKCKISFTTKYYKHIPQNN